MNFFNSFKKNNQNQTPNSDYDDRVREIGEELYKHSAELVAKNKTLSLLGELYEYSIQTLDPKTLARKICETIQSSDLNLAAVGIFLCNRENILTPLAFSFSKNIDIKSDDIDKNELFFYISNIEFYKKIFDSKSSGYTEKLDLVWRDVVDKQIYELLSKKANIKSSLVYPLVIESKVIGILAISFNRLYTDLASFEKESINSFVNVIAVALDKALLYDEVTKANNRLRELDKQKSEFVSFATHQLKSPLAAMKGYSSLILDGDYGVIPDGAKEAVSRIFESSKTLANVVEDYLNISRIELGSMKYNFTPIDIKKIIQDVLGELAPNIQKSNLKVSFDVDTKEYVVNADPDKIKQVFMNLIDNSVKYTPKGSVNIALEKEKAINGLETIRFSIKDTGIGMVPSTISALFQKFTRAYNANKTNIHGTGLGLYVAQEIVKAHGGKVWAESEGEGKGSQFYVELPAAR